MTDLILIDGHALAYRSYFGVRSRYLSPEGTLVNGVFGFGKTLLGLVEGSGAHEAAVVFDSPGPSFRRSLYPAYKANRPLPPDDFIPQLPLMADLANCLGIKVLSDSSFEADDLIAAAAVREAERGKSVVIVTPDKDLFQTLGEGDITIMRPAGRNTFSRMNASAFESSFGFKPGFMAEYQALMGDRSDNIPGVSGIGPVTARSLIRSFGDLESIYCKIQSVRYPLRARLEKDRDKAFMSRELARLRLDAPVPEDLFLDEPDREGSARFCERNGLGPLVGPCLAFRPCTGGDVDPWG